MCYISAIVAIIYTLLPYCYGTCLWSIARYASAAITTISFPAIVLFNLPFFSWSFFIVLAIISALVFLVSKKERSEKSFFYGYIKSTETFVAIGIISTIKFIDYFLCGCSIYGQRRLIAGFLMTIIFLIILIGIFELLKLTIRKILKGFRIAYCDYLEKPYEDSSNFLNSLNDKLIKTHSLSPKELNLYPNEDSILENEIEIPLSEYIKEPKYLKSTAFFPIKQLIISVILLGLVATLVGVLGYLIFQGYIHFIEKLLNFSIDNL